MKAFFSYLWRAGLCGIAFFAGIMAGSMVARAMGLALPELPKGTDAQTLSLYALIASLLLAIALIGVARGLSGGYVARWLALSLLVWISYGVNSCIEGAIFTTIAAASSWFTLIMYFFASLFYGAVAALLFRPPAQAIGFLANWRRFFSRRNRANWAWRLLAALFAFPLIYLAFGMLIAPLVIDYYRQGTNQLTLPGWGVLLPTQFVRSLLFLLGCLPVLILWRRSRFLLFASLGFALFMLVGGLTMMQAYWMPGSLRMVHALEILADEVVYAGALVTLMARNGESESEGDG